MFLRKSYLRLREPVSKKADIIVANDLNKITEKGHEAYLVGNDKVTQAHSKLEIAQLLYQYIHREEKT